MINFASNLNKMINAGLGGPLDPPRTEVAVGHRVIYTEASGDVVNFETNVIAPVKNLRVTMEPVQAGSGDPSPENIRPITGRDAVTVYRSGADMSDPQTVTVQLGQTVYGGTLDVNNGVLTVDTVFAQLTADKTYTILGMIHSATLNTWAATLSNVTGMNGVLKDGGNYWSSVTKTGFTYRTARETCFCQATTSPIFAISDNDSGLNASSTSEEVAAAMNAWIHANIPQIVYELNTPRIIQLTPAQLSTLSGENNVWSDAGNITLEFPYYEETEGY